MTLRVATWNLWWRFGSYRQREQAILHTLQTIDADVLCLQEVWSVESDDPSDRSDQADLLAERLGMHVVRTRPAFFEGAAFGNAIIARWPATLIADEALPRGDGSPGHRRVVAAHVDTPWGAWPCASTHLDHRFDASSTRQMQVDQLLRLAASWRGDSSVDLPVVVGADLNAVPDSEEVRSLTGRRPGVDGIVLSDVWEQAGDGPGSTWRRDNPHVADSAWPDRRLDYLLVSWPRPKPVGNPIRAWLAGDAPIDVEGTAVWPSDHAAVVADLITPV